MSEDQNVDSIDTPDAGSKKDTVSYETHLKLLKQRKADQERLKELEATKSKYDEMLQQKQDEEEKRLVEQGKLKEALDLRNNKIKEYEEKLNAVESEKQELQGRMLDSVKLQLVLEKLPGKVKKKEYYNFIDTSQISFDEETGDFDEMAIDTVANSFVEKYSELLDVGKGKKLPYEAGGSSKGLSYEDWLKLPGKEKAKRLHEVIDK